MSRCDTSTITGNFTTRSELLAAVWHLYFQTGLPSQEIAIKVGISTKSIKSIMANQFGKQEYLDKTFDPSPQHG